MVVWGRLDSLVLVHSLSQEQTYLLAGTERHLVEHNSRNAPFSARQLNAPAVPTASDCLPTAQNPTGLHCC